jgi:hypothetical protein
VTGVQTCALPICGKKGRIPEMWDGKTAERIGKAIVEYFDN